MFKRCICGEAMALGLRKVFYSKTVSITGVPVYACGHCARNEVYPGVKSDLSRLLSDLGAKPLPREIRFDEVHEWAGMLHRAASASVPLSAAGIAKLTEERTNELLDLLLIAASLEDAAWKRELEGRLSQLNGQYIA
ncbi:hypothetical protein OMP38_22815 [Cohnella ginsengisoli]|uniref:YgiT-type zinc finger protein n=1 Tax=Cohnella ginsengisoli TaxID=425004 RepID=A0A9X4QPC0_9BACL|nr:hypothetical protein [Cohnella ginsengisoli]MDG0793357.1 hypothetical protein [Cohnella ginsengisoli]